MRKVKKYVRFICIYMAFTFLFCIVAQASSLVLTDPNTSHSGWAFSTQNGHMGQRASTYSYESSTVQSAYGSYVSGGISLWGTNIAMSYTSSVSNAVGVFGVTDAAVNYNAATLVTSVNSSTGHRTGYIITISSQNFNSSSKTTAGKYRTIAHEIGHAYGLGHVPSSSNIMYSYYSATKNVTSQDIWGMKVVTHIHQHSSSTTGTYSEYSVDSHKVLCASCGGIYIQAHTFSSGVCTKCGYTQ